MILARYTIPITIGVIMLKSICGTCNKEFMYDQYDRNGKFCSRICYDKSRIKPTETICIPCGNKFSFHAKYRVKEPTCSTSCGQKLRQHKIFDKNLESLEELKKRYEKFVIKKEGCWDWSAAKILGYGTFKYRRKQYKAHRVSWLIHNGSIPEGIFVLHKCHKNKQCSNPEHLYLGTAYENMHDIINAGDKKLSLTTEKVIEIKKLLELGVPCTRLAEKFNTGYGAIRDIKLNKTWRHVKHGK